MVDSCAHFVFAWFAGEAKVGTDLVEFCGFHSEISTGREYSEEVIDVMGKDPVARVIESPMDTFCEHIVDTW